MVTVVFNWVENERSLVKLSGVLNAGTKVVTGYPQTKMGLFPGKIPVDAHAPPLGPVTSFEYAPHVLICSTQCPRPPDGIVNLMEMIKMSSERLEQNLAMSGPTAQVTLNEPRHL